MQPANPDTHTHAHAHTQDHPSTIQPANPSADTDSIGPASQAWMALLLVGYGIVLTITIATLATTVHHHWWLAAALTLALLTRLVPDALEVTDWACRGAPTWRPPLDPRPRLVTGLTAITARWPDYPEFGQWAAWLQARLRPRTRRSRLATVVVALCLAAMVAGWAAWQPPTPLS